MSRSLEGDHMEAQGAAREVRIASADQEAWVKERVMDAMTLALALKRAQGVRANEPAVHFGMLGIAEGAAIEIIRTLGMEPAGINLRTGRNDANLVNKA